MTAIQKNCSEPNCDNIYRARGYCATHYATARANGTLEVVQQRRKDDLCSRCREQTKTARHSYCKQCRCDFEKERRTRDGVKIAARQRELYDPVRTRRRNLAKYKLTLEGYEEMLALQNGRCAICGTLPGEGTVLHVDHDHACCPEKLRPCGLCVRGLLCPQCNNGLGRFNDDAERLTRAAHYLASRLSIAETHAQATAATWMSSARSSAGSVSANAS